MINIMRVFILGLFCLAYYSEGKPNGSPQDACFYMTPRHIHPHTFRKVFPTKAMGLYNITTSADVFRPDRPIRVTLWGPPFKGFMMVAAEEGAKDWPTGIFYSEDGSAKRLSCLGRGDTVTHQNNSYKDSVSVLWYGPENMMSEQIQFIATVVVNLTIYYTNIKSGFLRLDPSLHVAAGAEGAAGGAVTMDPWLAGETATKTPWWSASGSGARGGGGSSAWGLSALLGGGSSNSGQNWGSSSNSGWGSSQNSWGGSGSGSSNWWQERGSGSGSPSSSSNSWGTSGGWQQWGQPSSGNGQQWGQSSSSGQQWGQPSSSGQQWGQSSATGQQWGNSWANASAQWNNQGTAGNTQQSAPPTAESGKSKTEVWSWNWNSKSDGSAAGAAQSTPAPATTPAPAPAPANPGSGASAWSDNPSLQSTNVWAKLLDFVLQQSNQAPAAV